MHRSYTRWTTAAAAAALIALPVAGSAQTTGATPPQQPPAQTQPQQQPPAQQPAAQQPPASADAAQSGAVDANAAKKHLSDARDTLSQITQLPEAAKLQGDHRTQVSQLISNFNELITTPTDWRASYAKVDANLSALLGSDDPAAGTAAVGTSGSTPAAGASALDPAIKAKLVDFRKQLKEFEQAAGGSPAHSGAMAPSADPASTSNPANPASSAAAAAADPAKPGQPPTTAGATGTSGVMSSPTATMNPADQAKAAGQVNHAEVDKHLDAINDILNNSNTGALTKAQTTELKTHVEQLRALLKQGS